MGVTSVQGGKRLGYAYGIWLISGLLGGHRFYLGKYISGAAIAFLTLVSLPLMPEPAGALLLLGAMFWVTFDACFMFRLVREANSGLPLPHSAARFSPPQYTAVTSSAPAKAGAGRTHALNFDHSRSLAGAAAQRNRYIIDYADVDGVVTTRDIEVLAVTASAYAIYIRAFCRLRNAERTFRADRIVNARKASGIEVADIEEHFHEYIPEDDRADPDHDAVMGRVAAGLGILVWIANADREISSDEEEILLDFINERNGLAGSKYAAIPWSRTRAAAWIDAARPTFASSVGALAKISRTGREYALLTRYAEAMVSKGGGAAEHRRKQLFK